MSVSNWNELWKNMTREFPKFILHKIHVLLKTEKNLDLQRLINKLKDLKINEAVKILKTQGSAENCRH